MESKCCSEETENIADSSISFIQCLIDVRNKIRQLIVVNNITPEDLGNVKFVFCTIVLMSILIFLLRGVYAMNQEITPEQYAVLAEVAKVDPKFNLKIQQYFDDYKITADEFRLIGVNSWSVQKKELIENKSLSEIDF